MGAWGAIIMSFFGAVFATLTIAWQWHATGALLALPFIVFAIIGVIAACAIRLQGTGMVLSPRAERTIMWSTIAEGIGLFVAFNLVVDLDRLEWRLPAMAMIVGLHFLPIGRAACFRPYLILGVALILSAAAGFALPAPVGGAIAGGAAALCLWIAALLAIARDWRHKISAAPG